MPGLNDYPQRYFADRPAWRQWLEAHHPETQGFWLVYDKKIGAEARRLTYAAIAEEALCFGWIDGQARGHSATQGMILVTPRKRKSGWSKVNKARIEELTRAGLMTPAGQAKIDAAKQDGSWELLDAVEALTIPDELQAALAAVPGAAERFGQLAPSVRKLALQQIYLAKRPETRARRVAEAVKLTEATRRQL